MPFLLLMLFKDPLMDPRYQTANAPPPRTSMPPTNQSRTLLPAPNTQQSNAQQQQSNQQQSSNQQSNSNQSQSSSKSESNQISNVDQEKVNSFGDHFYAVV